MFGCERLGGVLRLAAEALDELVVARMAVVQDLDRDPTAEDLVLGEVDVRHPAHAKLAHDAVAPVEERVDQGVGNRHRGLFRVGIRPYRSSASITCLAIGAEIVPPKPLSWFSTTTAIATRGVRGREGREPRRVDVAPPHLCGAGLACDAERRDLRCCAGAAGDDELHHRA